ncbi:serine/threonine-protein kinase unc-51-like protein [Dinothrombium tinctorium]|uniref:non-specific serine/threonine protein kinase n=1 Tax=Dinothrombium tinctorium TaxID=1965070 RepID=A0A3S3PDD1_9ACAR|nr:serine/threonine-protein kinase unc-51-like protein [Dinothrombium tinctorium]RWS17177.1 serine/threonine-protein kinase unc-51-like protein [Dinothrombium tinctorium]
METIGEFEYDGKEMLGHGAFAIVYKGKHRTKHDLIVAIKMIMKKNLAKSQNLLGKEIKILKELTELHHENVVALLDCKETQQHVYLVMEYCNGGDLADYLQSKGTLSEDTIRLFLNQIARAMKALYTKGIVHRDLKPQNILLCHKKPNPAPNDIILKIADFGFARFLQDGVMAATLCGSPMYMAPEVIMSMQYDAKADLWSVGTIVFQCLTGKAPFQASTPQALKQFYEKNLVLVPKIPVGTSKELTDLLNRLLKRNAKDRMEFEEFFAHPFMKQLSTTKPLPVPRAGHSATEISSSSSSPMQSPVSYGSPMAMQLTATSIKQGLTGYAPSPTLSDSDEQIDGDFVVIPATDSNSNKILSGEVRYTCKPKEAKSEGLIISSGTPPEPVPVPTQKEAYEQIRRSCASSAKNVSNVRENVSSSNNNNETPPASPKVQKNVDSKNSSVGSETSGSKFITDISQLSPPIVQFVIGTPPNATTTSLSLSTRRRSVPIANSNLLSGRQTPPTLRQLSPPAAYLTNISKEKMFAEHEESSIALRSDQQLSFKWSFKGNSNDALSYGGLSSPHRNRLAFGSSSPKNYAGGELPFRCDKMVVQTSQSHTASQLHHCCCTANALPPLCYRGSETSPSYLEDQIFIAPELPEETLLDREHNETLAKLNFVLALVDCITELAESRINPLTHLTESTRKEIPKEYHRKAEQLVLYVRALQLISSALQLSKQEIHVGRLRTSSTVRHLLREMKDRFHLCLSKCKSIDGNKLFTSANLKGLEGITADRLIYDYAIEMCQSAALEELFGQPQECFRRYQTAQILLHSLSQQVVDEKDKKLLQKYKEAVEKRLFVLQQQGIVISYEQSA